MKAFWASITEPPYRNLPWVIWFYVVLSSVILYQNGAFTGHIIGFDDQVRMIQVLDWVNGHGFYDRTLTRVNAPEGFTSIWSRIVDIPLALVVIIAQQFVPQKIAACIAAIAVSLAELAILFVAAPYFARPLVGKDKARLIVLFILFTSILNIQTFSVSGFLVGEASHHPWYVILNLTMFGAVARLVMGSAARAPVYMLGFSIALLTAVGIEGYPMIAGACLVLALVAWGFGRPVVAARGAKGFALAALGSLVLLPMHQPPVQLFHVSFVEPSILGFILVACAALLLVVTQWVVLRYRQKAFSLFILMGAAAFIASVLVYYFPQILQGGAAGLSNAERKMALQGHTEGMPLHKVAHGVVLYVCLIAPIFLAFIAGIYHIRHTRGRRRALAVTYTGFVVIGFGMSEIYSRFFHHAMTTSCAWLAWIWEKIKTALPQNKNYTLYVWGSFFILCPLWMLVIPAAVKNVRFGSEVLLFTAPRPLPCDPLSITGFINQHYDQNTLINTPSWDAAAFSYYTNIRVDFLANYPSQDKFIDNYHFFAARNNDESRRIAAKHGFDLVVVCRLPRLLISGAPEQLQPLIALLQIDKPPVWLKKVETPDIDTAYILYEVDKKSVSMDIVR